MSGPTAIRVAALLALGYGVWVLLGGPLHVGAGGGSLSMRVSAGYWVSWLVGIVSLVLAFGLFARQAWAWWLGLAAALVQVWRLTWPYVGHGKVRMPGTTTLVVLVILIVFIVLLLVPKARASCNR